MHLFYTPDIQGNSHILNEDESKHAVRVLRLAAGDKVVLVDGKGSWYEASITRSHHRACALKITSVQSDYQPLPYYLHIAISPTKSSDRFEWFLEKSTEIGISEITPLLCHRTERKKLNLARLEKIGISAMKQSLKAYKPILNEAVSMEVFLKRPAKGFKGIAHCMQNAKTSLSSLKKAGHYTILVGPEGDFTSDELEMALNTGYHPLLLGTSRLRTETSGVHLCSAIQLLESQHCL